MENAEENKSNFAPGELRLIAFVWGFPLFLILLGFIDWGSSDWVQTPSRVIELKHYPSMQYEHRHKGRVSQKWTDPQWWVTIVTLDPTYTQRSFKVSEEEFKTYFPAQQVILEHAAGGITTLPYRFRLVHETNIK